MSEEKLEKLREELGEGKPVEKKEKNYLEKLVDEIQFMLNENDNFDTPIPAAALAYSFVIRQGKIAVKNELNGSIISLEQFINSDNVYRVIDGLELLRQHIIEIKSQKNESVDDLLKAAGLG